MPSYDTSFSPPAPVARVELWIGNGNTRAEVLMLLDSGSDVTIVPTSVARGIGAELRPYDVPLLTYDGEQVFRNRAFMSMRLLRYTFRGDFLVDDAETGILGRNVLNALVLTLDGPGLDWTAQTA